MNVVTSPARCRRQHVTVMFIDIVGYTALVEELDCAEVRALQMEYFARVSTVVRRFGGVVEKFVGDAVLAVFGVDGDPVAAARDAVRAGLAVQQALRGRLLAGLFTVRTRVGVATGEVIVDLDAARDGGQGMVSGRVVITASRLQTYAPHDTVVVCAQTRQVTDTLIAYQELPPMAITGRPYPVELWRALSAAVPAARPAERALVAA
ncbi:adenylate/guanylate cyclase domain-containing protein [Krasilnikovia cinnamomea]|uniref:adenylate/guanylate cyclase domain-containing protein n=1 Tax=Krasilnikovia cinnamomea TaxID=349313 RepID=UPI00102B001F|nr:adenylate/guanylate cyclase domain-containing protein [Krasilnikovia cinnamomea]